MNYENIKPVIYVSRCLGFDHCRWNGDMINDSFVNLIRDFVEFHDICPEADIGLGIPRNPVRLVRPRGETELKMMQPATGLDCTYKMMSHCKSVISQINRVDGFLLKNASPSCGINNIKIYGGIARAASIAKTAGMFTAIAKKKYPLLPCEDEGRLHNYVIRENWLISVFAIARLRSLKNKNSFKDLYDFQARYKYLFMSYSQSKMKELGHLLANHNNKEYQEVYPQYEEGVMNLFATSPSIPRRINVLMHILGYFSKNLSINEKQYFLNVLEEYRRGAMPLMVPLELIKSWSIRFENEYIQNQIILQPYPKELMILSDSGKGRYLRK